MKKLPKTIDGRKDMKKIEFRFELGEILIDPWNQSVLVDMLGYDGRKIYHCQTSEKSSWIEESKLKTSDTSGQGDRL